jgi:Fic family protein
MLREIGELNEIRSILVRHDEMLLRIIDYLKQLSENDELNCHIRDRRLRLLYTVNLFNENLCVSKLAIVVNADRKTIREDLACLTNAGLIAYTPPSSNRLNPGRKGCKPRLTQKGKSIALRAYDLDEEQNEAWLMHIDA